MWQSLTSGRKLIVPIDYFEIDFVTREVVVFYDKTSFKLLENLPLYIKLNYQMSIFKVTHFKQELDSIHLEFPKIMKTLDSGISLEVDSPMSLS